MGKSFLDTNPKTGRDRGPQLRDLLGMFVHAQGGELKRVRPIGDVYSIATHFVSKAYFKKGEKSAKKVTFPVHCVNWNSENETFENNGCPYCEKERMRPSIQYLYNVIDREAQDNEPRKRTEPTKKEAKSGFKDKDSKTWTPVFVVQHPPTAVSVLGKISRDNRVDGEARSITDPKYGMDLSIGFDNEQAGSAKNTVNSVGNTKLSSDEKSLLVWDIKSAIEEVVKHVSLESIVEQYMEDKDSLIRRDGDGKDIWPDLKKSKSKSKSDDYSDDDSDSSKKKASKKRAKSMSESDEDSDDEAPFSMSDSDSSEEEKKSKKSKGKDKKSKSKKSESESESESASSSDEDLSDSESSEEEKKSKKSKGKDKKSKSKKSESESDSSDEDLSDSSDEDLSDSSDDDLSDSDSSEEEKKSKKSKGKGKSKKSESESDSDEDLSASSDEDLSDSDSSEEEKKSKKSKGKSKSKKSKK